MISNDRTDMIGEDVSEIDRWNRSVYMLQNALKPEKLRFVCGGGVFGRLSSRPFVAPLVVEPLPCLSQTKALLSLVCLWMKTFGFWASLDCALWG